MTKQEILKLLEVIKGYKPALFKNMSQDDLKGIANAWYDTFKDYDAKVVLEVSKDCCANIVGIPDIAIIKNKIDGLNENNDLMYLWEKMAYAIGHSSQRVFDELPVECQRFARSVGGLKQLGMTDISTLQTVVKGQFLREVRDIKKDLAFEKRVDLKRLSDRKELI